MTDMPEPAAERPCVLVVEDEASIASMLVMTLNFLGFDAVHASTGAEALVAAARRTPDVVLLDVMLPDFDGFDVCQRLRANGVEAPVLFLTARSARADKLKGLTEGGDDYVTKPFDLNEVVARITALLRRRRSAVGQASRLRSGWVLLDQDSHEVWRHDNPVRLTDTEFRLLRFLMVNRGRVVSKQDIMGELWQENDGGDSGTIETYVYYLRRKLGDIHQTLIRTVVRGGYVMAAD